jgi:hypothetical protein
VWHRPQSWRQIWVFDRAFVFNSESGNISQTKVVVGDRSLGHLQTMSTANGIACRFPVSEALRSTTHIEQIRGALFYVLVTDFELKIQFINLLYDRRYCSFLFRLGSDVATEVSKHITVISTPA